MNQEQLRSQLKYHHDARRALIENPDVTALAGCTPVAREIILYDLQEVSTEALTEVLCQRGYSTKLERR